MQTKNKSDFVRKVRKKRKIGVLTAVNGVRELSVLLENLLQCHGILDELLADFGQLHGRFGILIGEEDRRDDLADFREAANDFLPIDFGICQLKTDFLLFWRETQWPN